MFERYSESARRALFFARVEASMKGPRAIEPEHLLAGLLREQTGVLARVLRASNVAAASLLQELERSAVSGEKFSTSVEIPFGRATRAVLLLAVEEADGLRHRYIEPEHLLLALLREEGTVASSILARHGLRVDQLRATVVRVVGEPAPARVGSRAEDVEQADRIKKWVDELARVRAGTPEAEAQAQRIHHGMDALRRMRGDGRRHARGTRWNHQRIGFDTLQSLGVYSSRAANCRPSRSAPFSKPRASAR